ncbi:MAG TPA: hypothetical protein GX708_01170 [Gallicola sp.]|nr:hypothetical protein [Gallicola sp.]
MANIIKTMKVKNKPKTTTINSTDNKKNISSTVNNINETKKKVGRPKFIIDFKMVEKLANIMCTREEIATILGCSIDTLKRSEEFSTVYKKGLENGKMSLRRIQFNLAKTNASMAIWLGKQYLGQRDNVENIDEEKTKVMIINDVGDEEEES